MLCFSIFVYDIRIISYSIVFFFFFHLQAKHRHLSTSEGNLLKSGFKLFNVLSRDVNNSARSASVEQDLQNRITVHEIDLQAPICDEGLLTECPVKPKPFKSISSAFPKPKKIF